MKLENYQIFFEQSIDLCSIATPEGYFVEVNKSFISVLGYPKETLLQDPFINFVHPEDVESTLEVLSSFATQDRVQGFVNRYRKSDGTYIMLSWNAMKIDDRIFSIARDVTEEKVLVENVKSKTNMLEMVTDNVPILISYVDENIRYQYVNNNYYRTYNKTESDILGRCVKDVMGEDNFAKIQSQVDQALSGEQVQYSLNQFTVGDVVKDYQVTYVPNKDECGTVKGFFALVYDITNLENARRIAEEAIELRTNFLANTSHELRTPLNSIITLSELLLDNKKENLTDKQLEYASVIKGAGHELLALINDLIDLSRAESGNISHNYEAFELQEFIRFSIAKHHILAEKKKLDFTFTISDALPNQLYSDPFALKKILNNLLSNAIKFTSSGSISLDISPQNDMLTMSVTDTGIGISEDHVNKIFDAFVQAESSISRRFGGTGLGLSISKQLANSLNGDISVRSTLNQGSTFTLSVPILPVPALVEA